MARGYSASRRQLSLDFPHAPSMGRDDFVLSPANETALRKLDSWPDWPTHVLLLIGPEGSGKTHLANIFADRSGGVLRAADALLEADLMSMLSDGPVILEDIDAGSIDEKALFHVLNLVREHQTWLLLTARSGPEEWSIALPDLMSRLRAADRTEILPPDDDLLRAVIVKLMSDRQLSVERPVIDYLIPRIERSLGFVNALVSEADRELLGTGRKFTRPMAARLIERIALTTGDGDTL